MLVERRNPSGVNISSFLVVVESDPNVEPLHWLEVLQLKKTVYSKPFVLPPGALG